MPTVPAHDDHRPCGGGLAPGEAHDTVDIVCNLVVPTLANGRKTLKLSLAAPKHPDAVVTLPDGSQQLAVPPGAVRLFRIILASEWGWRFDVSPDVEGAPIRFKDGTHAGHYHLSGAGDMALGLIGRSTVAGGFVGPAVRHAFNLYLVFAQPGGAADLRLRIDPDCGNPPPPPG